jgi:hypothetical protein
MNRNCGETIQFIKIRIPRQTVRAMAFVEMARRGRIVCLPDDVFIVPEPALELLDSLGCGYTEFGRGDLDYADKMLRDALALHAKKRKSAETSRN